MELKGQSIEIHLSTPLIVGSVSANAMIIKGKVIDQAGGGYWIQVEEVKANPKFPYKTIFIPVSKIDFIGLA